MIKISKRLQKIADMVRYDTLIDVGSDHALLPVAMLVGKRIKSAISTDIAQAPLERGRQNAQKHSVSDQIEFILTDGLVGAHIVRPNLPDVCTISGMGGETIIHILRESMETARSFKQLLLSPQRDIPALRHFLHKNGFAIVNEVMLIENRKFYNILDCEPSQTVDFHQFSDAGYIFGQHLIERKCPIFARFIKAEIIKYERIKRQEYADYLALCKEVLSCIN